MQAAHTEHAPAPGRHRRARLALALAAAAAIAAASLTPAGAEVGDWIGEVVSPAPEADGPGLSSLPAPGRLLVVADDGPWVVSDDGSKRRLGGYRDATWSPGGLYVAAARGRELVALEPGDGTIRWTRPAPGRVATPRWSSDGYRIAYRSGRDLFVAFGDNARAWRLARGALATAPAWRPDRPPGRQVLAFARGRRIRIVEVDSRRVFGVTAPGPVPRELWWSGARLAAVAAREVRVYGARGGLLHRLPLPAGLLVAGSALDSGKGRLAVAASRGNRASSELLLYRVAENRPPRRLFAGPGPIEGLAWSMDGRVLTIGRPRADQWVFVRPRGGPFEVASGIRGQFNGGLPARTGAFPRPAGWCYREPAAQGERSLPCSTGAAPSG